MTELNSERIKSFYHIYKVPQAAMLWCGIHPDEVEAELAKIIPKTIHSPKPVSVFTHPTIPDFEARCRVLQEAINNGSLVAELPFPLSADSNKELHNIKREDLKVWIIQNVPDEKPSFLFDLTERNALVTEDLLALRTQRDGLLKEVELLKANSEQASKSLGTRAERTFLNIIAALLEFIEGKLPEIATHPSFKSEANLIEILEKHFNGYDGLSQSTLSRKFPKAKRSLKEL